MWANLRKEAPGLGINETFWAAVDAVPLRGGTFRECYREIASGLQIDSILYLAAILLVISLITNVAAQAVVRRFERSRGAIT